MIPRAAKRHVKRFIAAVNARDTETMRDLVHLGAVFDLPDLPVWLSAWIDESIDAVSVREQGTIRGLTRFRRLVDDLHARFPDSGLVINDIVADRDRTVVHWTFQSRSGAHAAHSGMTIFAFSSGQISESHSYFSWHGTQAALVPQ